MSFTDIHGGLRNLSDSPDIAFQYQDNGQPWPSVVAAHSGTPQAYRAIGKCRFVDDGSGLKEYWYKGGIELVNLVPRFENLETPAEYLEQLNAIKDETAELKDETAALKDQTQDAATGVINPAGTYNASTGQAYQDATSDSPAETFTPTAVSDKPKGYFLEVIVAGTQSVTGQPVSMELGGRLLSQGAGVPWVYRPNASVPADRTVSEKKTTFIKRGKNLFNAADPAVSLGHYVSASTGALEANPGFNATGYIEVTAGQVYTLSFKHQIAWYNAAKIYISGSPSSSNDRRVTAPAGAVYLRCTVPTALYSFFQVEKGSAQTSYEPYGYILDSEFAVRMSPNNYQGVSIPKTALDFVKVKPGSNLFNPASANIALGYAVGYDNGEISGNGAFNATGFIPVEPGQTYILSAKNQIAWYDQDRMYLSGSNATDANRIQVAPANARFLRCTVPTAGWPTFRVNVGAIDLPYEQYAAKYFIEDVFASKLMDAIVSTASLVDKATTPEKTSFITVGKNLFNPADADVSLGKYVNAANGELLVNALYNATGYIPVTPGQQYTLSYKNQIAFYSKSKVFISGSSNTDASKTQTVPAGAEYVRCSVNLASWPTFQIESGSVQTSFESFRLKMASASGVPIYVDNLAGDTVSSIESLILSRLLVNTSQLAAAAVKPANTNFFVEGKNLCNSADASVVIGSYVDALTGATAVNPNYNATGFIRVTGGQQYTLSYKHQIAWYNDSKVFISGSPSTDTNKTQTAPQGAAFLRCSVNPASWPTFQVEAGAIQTSFESFRIKMNSASGVPIFVENLAPETISALTSLIVSGLVVNTGQLANGAVKPAKTNFFQASKNLFNPADADVATGKYVNAASGVLETNGTYNATGFIPVAAGQQYTLSYKHQIAWFNGSKGFISGSGSADTNKTQTAPAGAQYLRCSVNLSNWDTFQIELGTAQTSYEAYGYYLDKIDGVSVFARNVAVTQEMVNPILIDLAAEYCIAVGRTIEIYHNQIAWCGNINDYHFFWSGIGKSLKRKWSYTGTTVGNTTLTLRVFNNKMQQVATATTVVRVVSNIIDNEIKYTPIGDSLTNAKPWLAEVLALSNNKLISIGTRGGLKHEGRSGATSSFYLGNNSYTFDASGITGNDGRAQDLNPFWNPATSAFDFAYYKSNYNQSPDVVLIWLGTNGITLDPTANVSGIKGIVDGIRATSPNIHIYIVNTLYRANQNGIGVQTGVDGYSGSPAWKLEEDRKVFNLKVAVKQVLGGYSNLYFVPVADCHDSEYNYGAVATPVNPRATQTELIPVESVHPQTQGYMQIADIIFSSLAAHK